MNHIDQILAARPAGRLMSVDLLRGLAIAAMVLVNNPGSWSHVYAPLAHAEWHGWTPTDVIFPLFLYVVGLSIVLAQRGEGMALPGRSTWVRAAKLFGLGLFLALFYYPLGKPEFSWWRDQLLDVRILGVLQRIALVYLACCYLAWLCQKRQWLLWIATLALMWVAYALMIWVPYADSSGGIYRGQLAFGNHLGAWLDQLLLGREHLYYKNAQPFAFDPEGLVTTLPAISSGLLGVLAGLQFRAGSQKARLEIWFAGGVLMLVAGQLLHPVCPINKALWTPSFVLVTAGVSQLLLVSLYWLCDVRGYQRLLSPLLVFGVNAIALFMLAGVVGRLLVMIPAGEASLKHWLYTEIFAPALGAYPGSLAFALVCLGVFYGLLWQMYRRGIIWKV